MKEKDIKKLKRALYYYERVVKLVGDVYDSVEMQPIEFVRFRTGTELTHLSIVSGLLKEAVYEKNFLRGRIQVFEELMAQKTETITKNLER